MYTVCALLMRRHRELSRTLDTLRYECRRHDETNVIIGPVKMWYASIVMPWILLPVVLILKLIFDHAAFFVLLGSIWIGVFDLYCGHRIDNITRSGTSLIAIIECQFSWLQISLKHHFLVIALGE
jgi:hypothetical protein